MSWLSRLTPRVHRSQANQDASLSRPVTADPETCLMVFQNHWRQVSGVLEQQPSGGSGMGYELMAVRNHTDQMMCLLAEEQPAEGGAAPGPILETVLRENVLDQLLGWHLAHDPSPDSQGALLKLFEGLIGQGQQPLLQHRPVLRPLLTLLATCADPILGCPPALEGSLVLLLNQLCVCMAQQPAVLELLLSAAPGPSPQSSTFQSPTPQGPVSQDPTLQDPTFQSCAPHSPTPQGPAPQNPASQGPAPQDPTPQIIFSLLVPLIHREGSTGQQARDALLLIMATSASNQPVARYITENSYFCQVLAAGLSALYSSLPRKLEVRDDDWHALRPEDWVGVPSLVLLMNSLEFCNAVVQVSHPLVCGQLLNCVRGGFLEPVLGPALHKSSVEEMIASTAYLDLFLRSVTETDLLRTFLRFILLDRHDNNTIIDTLLTHVSSNSRLCMVTLSLFRTLLSLNCEDLMLQLILRYLLPCTHVMLSQRPAVREIDMYGKSADKFLSLIPECCHLDTAPPSDREDNATQERPSVESTVPPKPSTPSRLTLFNRPQGGGPDRTPACSQGDSVPMATDRPLPWVPEAGRGAEWEYLTYLRDARKGIELCAWGCRDWSAPYDGLDPSPTSAPPPPPSPTARTPLVMVPEHFSLHLVAVNVPVVLGPESSGSDQGDIEWDVTINEKCISVTSNSNKRSLQHLAPVTHDAPPPPQTPLSLSNGVGLGGVASISQDEGMEVKKVKREQGDDCSPAEAGQGWLTGGPPESCEAVGSMLSQGSPSQSTLLPLTVSSPHEMDPSKSLEAAPSRNSAQTPDPIPASVQSSTPTLDPIPAPIQNSTPTPGAVPAQSPTHTPQPIPAPTQSSTHIPDPIPAQNSVQTPDPIPAPTQNSAQTSDSIPASAKSSTPIPGSFPDQSPTHTPEPLLVPVPTLSARPQWAAAMSQGLDSVDSLIRELLERTSMALPGRDSDGQGISIEAFHQELQELEGRVRPLQEHAQVPAPGPVPTATEQEEDPPPIDMDSEPKSESLAKEVFSHTLSTGQPLSQPYTGPFMAVVFSKLECMLQNSLYVNILLTGILARLACYPQPLLRSFLLNTSVIFQPSVKSLVRVLESVKTQIEAFAAAQENFPDMLRRARHYLLARGKLDWSNPLGLRVPNLRRSDSLVKSRKPSLGELILRHTQSTVRARQAAQQALAQVRGGVLGGGAPGLERQTEALRVKNAVYGAVVFSEFLKELAALAQEHAVAMPFPRSQGAEE